MGSFNLDYFNSVYSSPPEVCLLSNGRYSVLLTAAGSGYSVVDGMDVTRWREDTTCDNWTSDTDAHKAIMAHADRSGPNTSWNSTHLGRGCSKETLFMNGYSGHLYCFAIN